MKYDRVISLGSSCQAAYQIRSHFPHQRETFPFDWLITKYDGLLRCINNRMRDLIDPGFLIESEVAHAVQNTKFDLLHVHDFRSPSNVLDPDWRSLTGQVKSKYEYLADRWNNVLSGNSSILFVRHAGHVLDNWSDTARLRISEANALCAAIQRAAPNCDFRVAFVNAIEPLNRPVQRSRVGRVLRALRAPFPPRLDSRAIPFNIDYTDKNEWPDEGDWWKGSTTQWRGVFDAMQATT